MVAQFKFIYKNQYNFLTWISATICRRYKLYIALPAQSLPQSLFSVENCCLSYLRASFCHNGVALNRDKSDAVLFGTRNKLGSLSSSTHVNAAGTSVQLSKKVEILGPTLDP